MKKSILTTLSVMYAIMSFAQQTIEQSIPTKSIEVVVLESYGNSYCKSSSDNELYIKSQMQVKGKVRGVTVPAERPEFELEYYISSDTLYLKTPQRFSPKIIGISDYSESITNTIEVPRGKKLIIIKAGDIHFDDLQNNLLIQSAQSISLNKLMKANIAELKCTASQSLSLNQEKRAKEFELHGSGNQFLAINATRIQLHIQ